MQASKWIKIGVLVTQEELAALLESERALLFPFGRVMQKEEVPMTTERCLQLYGQWLAAFRRGESPDMAAVCHLPIAWSVTSDAVSWKELPQGRCVVTPKQPVVQIQAHSFRYSPLDHSIRSMVLSRDAIAWGLQFSYPQIYQEPETMDIVSTQGFPNARLFQRVRAWIRNQTQPTPFVIEGKVVMSPLRIGKGIYLEMERHPHLIAAGLSLREASHVD